MVLRLGVLVAAWLLFAAGSAQATTVKFSPGAAGIGDPYFPLDGNGGYDVSHYDLNFEYDPATDVLAVWNGSTRRPSRTCRASISTWWASTCAPCSSTAIKRAGGATATS